VSESRDSKPVQGPAGLRPKRFRVWNLPDPPHLDQSWKRTIGRSMNYIALAGVGWCGICLLVNLNHVKVTSSPPNLRGFYDVYVC